MYNDNNFKDSDFNYFMGCHTSHSNLNDSLVDKLKMELQLSKTLLILNKLKVVTANSKILYDFLKPYISNIVYCRMR